MGDYKCFLCGQLECGDLNNDSRMIVVQCRCCGKYEYNRDFLDEGLRDDPDTHLISGYTREKSSLNEWTAIINREFYEQLVALAPSSVTEKGYKLLESLRRQSEFFGQRLDLLPGRDYPLGYAKNASEFNALIKYLDSCSYIEKHSTGDGHLAVTVMALGHQAIDSHSSQSLTVFISSTCYDLLDLRFELAEFLESQGHIVRLSEDPDRINVDPTVDSIKTCLQNLETSDVVICILDRRYGGILRGTYGDLSATEVEIDHARKLEKPKPIYTFVRNRACDDYNKLCADIETETQWVEPNSAVEKRKKWLGFYKKLTDLKTMQKANQEYSNWFNQFKSSVDLKQLALKHLTDFQCQRQNHLGNKE